MSVFRFLHIISMTRLCDAHTQSAQILLKYLSASLTKTLTANNLFGVVTVATNVAEVVLAILLFLVLPIILM